MKQLLMLGRTTCCWCAAAYLTVQNELGYQVSCHHSTCCGSILYPQQKQDVGWQQLHSSLEVPNLQAGMASARVYVHLPEGWLSQVQSINERCPAAARFLLNLSLSNWLIGTMSVTTVRYSI